MSIRKNKTTEKKQSDSLLHAKLPFAGAEAYKLLRTNLSFVLPDDPEKPCKVIGVTSSVRSEGKSVTSVNLAYTLSETGKMVLLIDADMRLSTIGKKLGLPNTPGLSNYLALGAGNNSKINFLQSNVRDSWFVIPSGDVPPNPSELLGSSRMKLFIEFVSKRFDYIILDLPPVNIVSDALVVSPLLDTMLVVVRENYSDRKNVSECIRRLEMSKVRIAGFVLNSASEEQKRYGNKEKKYYKQSK